MLKLLGFGLALTLTSGCSQVADCPGLESELLHQRARIERLNRMVDTLSSADSAKSYRIRTLECEVGELSALVAKQETDMQTFVQQLEAQLAQINEMGNKVEEQRARLVNNLSLAARLQSAMQRIKELEQQLAAAKQR